MSTIGSRIKQARLELGLSQSELAIAADVSQPTVANWENDSHEPRQSALDKLTPILKTNPTWLKIGSMHSRDQTHNTDSYLARPVRHVPILSWPTILSVGDITDRPAHDYLTVSIEAKQPFALLANDPNMAAHFPIGSAIIFDAIVDILVDGSFYLFGIDGKIILRRWQSEPDRLEALPNQSAVDAQFMSERPTPLARAMMSFRRH